MAVTQDFYVIMYDGEMIMDPNNLSNPLYFNTEQEAQAYVDANLDLESPNYYCINAQTIIL